MSDESPLVPLLAKVDLSKVRESGPEESSTPVENETALEEKPAVVELEKASPKVEGNMLALYTLAALGLLALLVALLLTLF